MHVGRAEVQVAGCADFIACVRLEVFYLLGVAPVTGDVVENVGDFVVAKLRPGRHGAVVGHAVDFDWSLHAEQHGVHQDLAAAGVVDIADIAGERRERSGYACAVGLVAGGADGICCLAGGQVDSVDSSLGVRELSVSRYRVLLCSCDFLGRFLCGLAGDFPGLGVSRFLRHVTRGSGSGDFQ